MFRCCCWCSENKKKIFRPILLLLPLNIDSLRMVKENKIKINKKDWERKKWLSFPFTNGAMQHAFYTYSIRISSELNIHTVWKSMITLLDHCTLKKKKLQGIWHLKQINCVCSYVPFTLSNFKCTYIFNSLGTKKFMKWEKKNAHI